MCTVSSFVPPKRTAHLLLKEPNLITRNSILQKRTVWFEKLNHSSFHRDSATNIQFIVSNNENVSIIFSTAFQRAPSLMGKMKNAFDLTEIEATTAKKNCLTRDLNIRVVSCDEKQKCYACNAQKVIYESLRFHWSPFTKLKNNSRNNSVNNAMKPGEQNTKLIKRKQSTWAE